MTDDLTEAARTVMRRCDLLATYSEETGCLTRRFATPPMRQVHEHLKNWLLESRMTVELDVIGNMIGRYEANRPGGRTLVLGSHLDTVRNAGRYDGILGVMVALVCLERLHARGKRLPFAVELLGFADEEGMRYQSIYMGSKAATGTFNPQDLDLLDAQGVSMARALQSFGRSPDPVKLTRPRWQREMLLGYCEVHIEQGPVLESRDLPLAAVTSIVGQQRLLLRFNGETGHAGTLPMSLRHDALCAAAEFILAAEALGKEVPGLVTTVGQIQAQPGASNVVPGLVELSLDIRHADDELRERYATQLCSQAEHICTRRGVGYSSQLVQNSQTVTCAPQLVRRWQRSLSELGYEPFTIASGAGHDAVAMSELTDVAMLFIRCRGGISHNPAESVQEGDIAAAIAALERFLLLTENEVYHGKL